MPEVTAAEVEMESMSVSSREKEGRGGDASAGNDNDESQSIAESIESAIPVTLLSGFLGAGKTTVLRRILESTEHQLKVAVIVNDMAELNIDGEAIRKVKKEVITLQNGCICCTLRGDLIKEINKIQAEGCFDYVMVESTGIAEPRQVAESFCVDPDTLELADDPDAMLWRVARLDTCVTVVDACEFPRQLVSLQRFKDAYSDGLDGPNAEDDEGEKNIANLLVEQVEFANVILLNKTDLVSHESAEATKSVIQAMNPGATILTTQFGALDPKVILNTRLFDMGEAATSPGWLTSLSNHSPSSNPSKSESDEYGVSSFVYRARTPFHPARLRLWLEQLFVFQRDVRTEYGDSASLLNSLDALGDTFETSLRRYGNIFRSKGFCWIAGRDSHMAGWEHAGRLFSLPPLSAWYVSTPEDEWGAERDDDLAAIKAKFEGPHGDRRQEIVFIGVHLQVEEITRALNGCLLSDDEMRRHKYSCEGKYFDPLPPWTYHYVEPCVMATVLRPGQVHKFNVHHGVGLTLSNAALNVDVEDGAKPVSIRLWVDFASEDNQRTSSSLIATLRSGSYQQHSFQLLFPGTESEDHGGPVMLRVECVSDSGRLQELVEVYITGSVAYLPEIQHVEHDCDGEQDQHLTANTSKRRKVVL